MTPAPETVSPECSLLEARRVMDAGGFRHLPVVEGDVVVGIVSDRDLRSAWPAVAAIDGASGDPHEMDRRLAGTRVDQIMTREPLVVGPHTSLADAARLLTERQVGALPVVSGRRIVGILSEADGLRALMSVLALLRGSHRAGEPRVATGDEAPL
jgi:acetoin utilization protein AcuB